MANAIVTYQEFVEQTIVRSGGEEPFCPFPSGGYCDTPCSAACYNCEYSLADYSARMDA